MKNHSRLVSAERFGEGKLHTVSSILCSYYCEVNKLRGESRTGFSKKKLNIVT